MQSQKNVFWEALIIAVFIFGVGILLGLFIENSRAAKISDLYLESEINVLDVKVQTEVLNLQDVNCDSAVKENINFGNQIFEEARLLDDYEEASRISDTLKLQHKRYDLLRTLFWINSIKIKEKCGETFHTVIYLYDYKPSSAEEESKQEVISRFLQDLKKQKGDNIVLIPIAKNLDLISLDLLLSDYDTSAGSLIIVDEELVVSDLESLNEIFDYLP